MALHACLNELAGRAAIKPFTSIGRVAFAKGLEGGRVLELQEPHLKLRLNDNLHYQIKSPRGLTDRPFSCAPPPLVELAEAAKIDAKRLTQSIGKSGGVSAATAC